MKLKQYGPYVVFYKMRASAFGGGTYIPALSFNRHISPNEVEQIKSANPELVAFDAYFNGIIVSAIFFSEPLK